MALEREMNEMSEMMNMIKGWCFFLYVQRNNATQMEKYQIDRTFQKKCQWKFPIIMLHLFMLFNFV